MVLRRIHLRWGRVRIAVMKRRILVIRRVFSIPSDSEVGQKVRQPAPRVSVAADGNMLRRDEGVQDAFLHGLRGGLKTFKLFICFSIIMKIE